MQFRTIRREVARLPATTMLTENLAERMDAEFAAAELKVKQLQKQQVEQYE